MAVHWQCTGSKWQCTGNALAVNGCTLALCTRTKLHIRIFRCHGNFYDPPNKFPIAPR
eukprot:gene25193-biopygen19483